MVWRPSALESSWVFFMKSLLLIDFVLSTSNRQARNKGGTGRHDRNKKTKGCSLPSMLRKALSVDTLKTWKSQIRGLAISEMFLFLAASAEKIRGQKTPLSKKQNAISTPKVENSLQETYGFFCFLGFFSTQELHILGKRPSVFVGFSVFWNQKMPSFLQRTPRRPSEGQFNWKICRT